MNDAARLVDELTTLLYETLKAWQTQDGRHHQIVQCGACRRKADKPESVVHESNCPVYRLQRAEAANDAVIKGNAEEIADLEDARDVAEARANAEWVRAETLTQDNARLRERLAAVEAALSRLRAGCMVPSGLSCRLCHGTWLSEDGETAADHHDGCPLLETAQGAALAATPAAGEVE